MFFEKVRVELDEIVFSILFAHTDDDLERRHTPMIVR